MSKLEAKFKNVCCFSNEIYILIYHKVEQTIVRDMPIYSANSAGKFMSFYEERG
jgi:hypothetical protein